MTDSLTHAGNSAPFVVLRHEVGSGLQRTADAHLDWMFSDGDKLLTWSTQIQRDFDGDFLSKAERLADHRTAYLTYEGAISGDRGKVTRLIGGTFEWLKRSEDVFQMQLQWATESSQSTATIEIYRTRDGDDGREAWELRFTRG